MIVQTPCCEHELEIVLCDLAAVPPDDRRSTTAHACPWCDELLIVDLRAAQVRLIPVWRANAPPPDVLRPCPICFVDAFDGTECSVCGHTERRWEER